MIFVIHDLQTRSVFSGEFTKKQLFNDDGVFGIFYQKRRLNQQRLEYENMVRKFAMTNAEKEVFREMINSDEIYNLGINKEYFLREY